MSRDRKMKVVLAVGVVLLLVVVWSQWGQYKQMLGPKKKTVDTDTTSTASQTSSVASNAVTSNNGNDSNTTTASDPAFDVPLSFGPVITTAPPNPFHPLEDLTPGKPSSPGTRISDNVTPIPDGSGGNLPVPPAAVTQVQPTVPVLKGVIQGSPSIAVLEYDGQVFFAKIGDTIAGEFILRSIGKGDVMLLRNKAVSKGSSARKEREIPLSVEGG